MRIAANAIAEGEVADSFAPGKRINEMRAATTERWGIMSRRDEKRRERLYDGDMRRRVY